MLLVHWPSHIPVCCLVKQQAAGIPGELMASMFVSGLVVDLVMREQSKYELTLLNIWVSDLRFERTAGEVKLYLFIFIKPVFTGEYSCTGIGWIFCRWVWICLSVCLDNIRDKLSHGSFGSSTAKDTQISRILFLCFRND